MVNSRTLPFSSAATCVTPVVVTSSRPSDPCTTHACVVPSCASACAKGAHHALSNTPIMMRLTKAGLARGPRRLKIVLIPSSARTGPTWRIAAWWRGAIKKQILVAVSAWLTSAISQSSLMLRHDNTSAAPLFEDTALLPCLATGTPHPATTKAVAVDIL